MYTAPDMQNNSVITSAKTARAGATAVAATVLSLLVWLLPPSAVDAQSTGPAKPASERLFTSFDIAVDRRARSAAEARGLAISDAEQRAFRMLLEKIVASDDVALIRMPGPRTLRGLLRGFEVEHERSSSTRYLASLTITFEPEKIRAFLARQKIPFSEAIPRPLLILPVWRRGGAYLLWEDSNIWRQAWEGADSKNRLMDLRFAGGGFTDQLALTGHQAFRGSPAVRLQDLAARYGAEETLVVVAENSGETSTGRPVVNFSFRQGWAGEFTSGQIIGGAGETEEALMRRAANAVMARLDLSWKARTLTHFGESRRLVAALAVDKIEDWISFRDRLKKVPLVRELTVERLALPVSMISIRYVGGMDQLQLALRQVDLNLREFGDDWLLTELVDQSGSGRR